MLVTVPPPFPARFTVSRNVVAANVATAFGVVVLTVNVQVVCVLALHGPAVQPVKTSPVPGVAVRVTDVPAVKVALQTLGGPGFAQLSSAAIVGFEVLVTDPLPVMVTVKMSCCAEKSAMAV